MAHRFDQALAAILEFLARSWPFSKTEEQVIGNYQAVWGKRERNGSDVSPPGGVVFRRGEGS